MEQRTFCILIGEKRLNSDFEYGGIAEPIDGLDLMEDVTVALEYTKNVFLLALARLNDRHKAVSIAMELETVDVDQPNMVWTFSVLNFDDVPVKKYRVTDIVCCTEKSTQYINVLGNANPGFADKQYLADVGIEQALNHYIVT